VWDQDQLDQLYANSFTYLHGHSVGGTNPSLLRAVGAGAAVLAFDVDFNREVVGKAGRYFSSPADVAALLHAAESDPTAVQRAGRQSRELAKKYDWESVAAGYEQLALDLAARRFPVRRPSGRRSRPALPKPTVLPVRRVADLDGVIDLRSAAVQRARGAQQ
jgi:hypothetical protein